jgi:hypothetical protein
MLVNTCLLLRSYETWMSGEAADGIIFMLRCMAPSARPWGCKMPSCAASLTVSWRGREPRCAASSTRSWRREEPRCAVSSASPVACKRFTAGASGATGECFPCMELFTIGSRFTTTSFFTRLFLRSIVPSATVDVKHHATVMTRCEVDSITMQYNLSCKSWRAARERPVVHLNELCAGTCFLRSSMQPRAAWPTPWRKVNVINEGHKQSSVALMI